MTGWWYTYPSEKYEFVSWDEYMEKTCSKAPTNDIHMIQLSLRNAHLGLTWDQKGCSRRGLCVLISLKMERIMVALQTYKLSRVLF